MSGDVTLREVTLREVTKETVRAVCDLRVRPGQDGFVAPNAVSIAEAHFEPHAWFRAVHAADRPVGFVMIYEDPHPETPTDMDEDDVAVYYLWRFMIDGREQGKGYGRRAMELAIEHVREQPNATAMYLSVVPGEGSAEAFYARFGFARTGRVHEGEVEMRLPLDRAG